MYVIISICSVSAVAVRIVGEHYPNIHLYYNFKLILCICSSFACCYVNVSSNMDFFHTKHFTPHIKAFSYILQLLIKITDPTMHCYIQIQYG